MPRLGARASSGRAGTARGAGRPRSASRPVTGALSDRLRPAIVLAGLGLLTGVLLHRVDLIALGAPFALVALAGLVSNRPPELDVAVEVGGDRAVEGDELDVRVRLRSPSGVGRVEVVVDAPTWPHPRRSRPAVRAGVEGRGAGAGSAAAVRPLGHLPGGAGPPAGAGPRRDAHLAPTGGAGRDGAGAPVPGGGRDARAALGDPVRGRQPGRRRAGPGHRAGRPPQLPARRPPTRHPLAGHRTARRTVGAGAPPRAGHRGGRLPRLVLDRRVRAGGPGGRCSRRRPPPQTATGWAW